MAVTFNLTLEGGAYLTQNVKGNITLQDADDTVKLDPVSYTHLDVYKRQSLNKIQKFLGNLKEFVFINKNKRCTA